MDKAVKDKAIGILNKILEIELAGVVRYTHYSLMIYGHSRIPIVSWMKSQAQEALDHAYRSGELVTLLGGHPSLKIGKLLETERHNINDILQESLEHEKSSVEVYYELLRVAEGGGSVLLEEYARELIATEELHLDEVNKMLRRPGDVEAFKPRE
jgi:bacterioferritin